jgi:hypothetical protein
MGAVAAVISDEQKAAESDACRLVAKLQCALESLTETVNQALEVISEGRAILAKFEEPDVIRFDEALAARDGNLSAEVTRPPLWNPTTRTLSIGDRVVKQFRVPAHNQEAILAAFQEEGWPNRIDDPLPYSAGVKAKYRLHFTIGRLNGDSRQSLIRFFGDGTGEGICWELRKAAAPPTMSVVSDTPDRRRVA